MPPKKPAPSKPTAAKSGASKPASKPQPKPVEKPPSVEIDLKQLNVVLDDADKSMANTGRWPLIIDSSGASSMFLKYRANWLDHSNAIDFHPEKIRLALLGALRYGKCLCLDLGDEDSYKKCVDRFSEILPDLMDLILSKEIMKIDQFSKLVKSVDDDEYRPERIEAMAPNFTMAFVTGHATPDPALSNKCYIVNIKPRD